VAAHGGQGEIVKLRRTIHNHDVVIVVDARLRPVNAGGEHPRLIDAQERLGRFLLEFLQFQIRGDQITIAQLGLADDFSQRPPMLAKPYRAVQRFILADIEFQLKAMECGKARPNTAGERAPWQGQRARFATADAFPPSVTTGSDLTRRVKSLLADRDRLTCYPSDAYVWATNKTHIRLGVISPATDLQVPFASGVGPG